ncbi:hypothetical protein EGW08_006420 [Elysia chlorotica]|uniref:Globin n=1 Tax=Elysia chlorotica TaxID=188477 RepID=A0A433TW36_ELYCH|nr:hypothetical protein EGW08_006420 [Elysia chlorotica]
MGAACDCQMSAEDTLRKRESITLKDTSCLLSSWKNFTDDADMKILSLRFFNLVLETHPEVSKYFEFTGSHYSSSQRDLKMKTHTLIVLHRLGTIVGQVENPPIMIGLMEKLAKSHVKKGITHDEMEKFTAVFMTFFVEQINKPHLQAEMTDSWSKFVGTLLKIYKMVEEEKGIFANPND